MVTDNKTTKDPKCSTYYDYQFFKKTVQKIIPSDQTKTEKEKTSEKASHKM